MNYNEFIDYLKEEFDHEKREDILIFHPSHKSSYSIHLPFEINKKLCYLAGVIYGDGHLKKGKNRVIVELANRDFILILKRIFKTQFKAKPIIREIEDKRPNRKTRFMLEINSKIVKNFFHHVFNVPIGSKDEFKLPNWVLQSNKSLQLSFLAGVFDTDGGIHSHYFGVTTKDREFSKSIKKLLEMNSFQPKIDSWLNKKYQKKYWNVYLNKEEFNNILNKIPIKNRDKILYLCTDARVVKGARNKQF